MYGSFPLTRMRRNRRYGWLRNMTAEYRIDVSDLILPLFVQEGSKKITPVTSLPDVSRFSCDALLKHLEQVIKAGIPAVALFPVVDSGHKTDKAEEAWNEDNLICRTVIEVKKQFGDQLGVICDVALDPYTAHGHDGIIKDGLIDNDLTLEALSKQALSLALAGADIVAPSDMMDGRIQAIRSFLDGVGYSNCGILSYAAKYASCFYGPFRDAVGSNGQLQGASKATYQMNPANSMEAIQEISLDIAEGADMVMIKPGLPYLDIIARARKEITIPIFAYQVSGEYAMLHTAAQANALDLDRALAESILCFKRAGANGIFTYGALRLAQQLQEKSGASLT